MAVSSARHWKKKIKELTFAVGIVGLEEAGDDAPDVAALRNVSPVRGTEAESDHKLVHYVRGIFDSEIFVNGGLRRKCVARDAWDDDVEGGRGRGSEDGDNIEEFDE